MLEFTIGLLSGISGTIFVFRKTGHVRSIGVQAVEVWSQTVQTQPILIINSKPNFVPKLKNFWGPDS